MLVVCSSGLNVPTKLAERLDLATTGQHLVIGETSYELLPELPLSAVHALLVAAQETPYLRGSTIDEFVKVFTRLLQRTDEVLVVAGTRYGVGTYQAAVAAAELMMAEAPQANIRIVDTGLMELGAGLVAVYSALAAQEGRRLAEVATVAATLGARSAQFFAPASLDALTTSHRSGQPKTISNLGGFPPILQVKDGIISHSGYFVTPDTRIVTLRMALEGAMAPGSEVVAAIAYAGDPAAAHELLAELERSYVIRHVWIRHVASPGYVMLGPDSLGVSLHPVDAMPFNIALPKLQ